MTETIKPIIKSPRVMFFNLLLELLFIPKYQKRIPAKPGGYATNNANNQHQVIPKSKSQSPHRNDII